MISRKPKVFINRIRINHISCFLFADFQSAHPFQKKLQIKKGIKNSGLLNAEMILFISYIVPKSSLTRINHQSYLALGACRTMPALWFDFRTVDWIQIVSYSELAYINTCNFKKIDKILDFYFN